jgi:hypothetical protein
MVTYYDRQLDLIDDALQSVNTPATQLSFTALPRPRRGRRPVHFPTRQCRQYQLVTASMRGCIPAQLLPEWRQNHRRSGPNLWARNITPAWYGMFVNTHYLHHKPGTSQPGHGLILTLEAGLTKSSWDSHEMGQ